MSKSNYEVNVYPVKENKTSLKAFVTLTINEEFVVKGLRLIEGSKGLFVAF